jgi:hypothetical protein
MYTTLHQTLRSCPARPGSSRVTTMATCTVSSLDRESTRNPYFQLKDSASFVAYRMRPRT